MSQTILVTGANRGIGLALARELLAGNHTVIAAARQPEDSRALQELELKYAEHFFAVKLDVNSSESVNGAAELLEEEIDALDVLVNNAAIFPEDGDESILEIELQHFRDAFETNVLGVIRATRAFLPLLQKAKNPRIVNISSGAGSISAKDDNAYIAYSTSKAALNMVTRAMAAEFRKTCVVAITPGWVRTDMGGSNAPLSPKESARAIAKTITNLTLAQTSKFLERTGAESSYAW